MNIEDKVRNALHARADVVQPREDGWPAIESETSQTGQSVRRRITAAVVAAALAVGGLSIIFVALRPSPPSDQARQAAWSLYPSGWTQLPRPTDLRGSAWAWTGSELIAWGGVEEGESSKPSAAGSRFDPTIGAWRPMPRAPQPRTDATAVWTGQEVLFWGGWDGETQRVDGLRFEPESGEWAQISSAPLTSSSVAVIVWTGTEMIVWGGGQPDSDRSRRGAAYDPASNSWRELAPAPLGLSLADGVWTGRELIVFGSLLDGRNIASTETAVGARYDPIRDRWSELEVSQLSPQATAMGLVGGDLLAYDYLVRSQTYDLARERWSEPNKMPLRAGECYPALTVVQNLAFAFYCGQAATYVPGRGWSQLTGGMLDETHEVEGNSYPLYRFATIVPASEGIILAVEGITTSASGHVCYGCPGAPRAVWFWRM